MVTDLCSRWYRRCARYRPAGEVVDVSRVVERRFPGVPPAEVVYDALRGLCGATAADDGPEARGLQWVIVGGESGPSARPFDLAWARSIVAQCAEAGVACFVKQLGARPVDEAERHHPCHVPYGTRPVLLRDRAGADPAEWPADLRVQQFPGGAP